MEKARKFLYIRHYGSKCTVSFNEKAIAEQKKYHGYFALLSDCEKNPFDCLLKYRRHETIEFFFESGKQRADGNRARMWSSECLMGRMFVLFVALCYYEYLSEQLRQIKQSLSSEIANPVNETSEVLKIKKKLLFWLKNTPVYLILQWYDAVEEVRVSSKLLSKRWTTEITACDRLFLEKLAVTAF
ncbi:MAG: hypothetical protein SOR75_01435 [Synergistes jonesii]|uniref:hypothetical protein n=1 Tax=Synergistes jonesii TaxID=2754 RepID=UPI002A75F4C4|nr:hypothetical protein [Synergistes jonesii]MDY2983974.1 hypothetical protein [Synergistes jonesii]